MTRVAVDDSGVPMRTGVFIVFLCGNEGKELLMRQYQKVADFDRRSVLQQDRAQKKRRLAPAVLASGLKMRQSLA
jgi:hypothetical protein